MVSIGGLLSIARSGLMASQAQVTTASQNITNAQTPGYSRQRVTLQPNTPQQLPFGTFGTGVLVDGTERMRNALLDDTYRRDVTSAAYNEERRDALQAVENVLGEPSDTGLASSLDQFWSAWSDLSTDPTSSSAKGVVRQRGAQIASQLNSFGNKIIEAQTLARTRMLELTDRVNALSQQVAEINARITAAEASGHESPDMRDQRDMKVDELSSLVGATAYRQPDGSVTVSIGGDSIVDGANFKIVRVQAPLNDPTKLSLALGPTGPGGASTETMYNIGGQMSGMMESYNSIYPDSLARLDSIAAAIVSQTNAVHTTGFIGGTQAGNFFAAGGTTARTIALDSTIASNVNNVAVSGIANESGDNSIARALSQLRDTRISLNGQTVSINEGYRTVVSQISIGVSAANGTATSARTLASATDARRDSVKGVSIDEEMVSLMKYQQSYAAAARLINVVDEMSQTLINLGR